MELILTKAELKGILNVTKNAKDKAVSMNGVLSGLGEAVEVSAWDGNKFYNAFISLANTCEGAIAFHALNFTKKLGAVCKAMAKDDLLRIHYEAEAESFIYELGSFTGESPAFDTTQALEQVESLKARNHVALEVGSEVVAGLGFIPSIIGIKGGKLYATNTRTLAILDIETGEVDDACFDGALMYGATPRIFGGGFKILGANGDYRLEFDKGAVIPKNKTFIDFERVIPQSLNDKSVTIKLSASDKAIISKRVGLINEDAGLLCYDRESGLYYKEVVGEGDWQQTMRIRLETSHVEATGDFAGKEVDSFTLGIWGYNTKYLCDTDDNIKLQIDNNNEISITTPYMIGDDYVAMPHYYTNKPKAGKFVESTEQAIA